MYKIGTIVLFPGMALSSSNTFHQTMPPYQSVLELQINKQEKLYSTNIKYIIIYYYLYFSYQHSFDYQMPVYAIQTLP